MNELVVNSCNECGSSKFSCFSKLDFEQQIVAQRKAGEAYRLVKEDAVEVCVRCFSPLPITEKRA